MSFRDAGRRNYDSMRGGKRVPNTRNQAFEADMTQGSIPRLLIHFSVPLLAGTLLQQMYGFVDAWIVGNYVSDAAFSALGALEPIILTLVNGFVGFSSGAGVVIAFYYGSGRHEEQADAVHTALAASAVISLLLTVLGVSLSPLMLQLMKVQGEVFDAAVAYLRIYFGGVTGLCLFNVGSSVLQSVGDTKHPFIYLTLASLINVALDFLFVIRINWGVHGVAFATILAQSVAAILTLGTLAHNGGSVQLDIRQLRIHRRIFREMLSIGLPSSLQMTITSFSNVFVQSYINQFGTLCMGGWTAFSKLDAFAFLPAKALSSATMTFVSQNRGRGEDRRIKEGVARSAQIAGVVMTVISLCLLTMSKQLIHVFSDNEDIIHYGIIFIWLQAPFYIFAGAYHIYAGTLRGLGKSRDAMWIMLLSFVVFRQAYLFAVSRFIANELSPLTLGYPLCWAVCAALLYARYCKYTKNEW